MVKDLIFLIRSVVEGICLHGGVGRIFLKIRNRIGFDREMVIWDFMEMMIELFNLIS